MGIELRNVGRLDGYENVNFIGRGQFGFVYSAEKDGERFAIKIIPEDFLDTIRVLREVEVLKNAKGDNILSYFDDFKHEINGSEYYCIATPYIEGKNLEEFHEEKGINYDYSDIFKGIMRGLNELEQNKIIHRDLKPSNILISPEEEVYIVDFGLSKLINEISITQTGDQLGTYLYISPEQYEDSKHIDGRSDLYSAGIVMYEMVTGHLPYEESTTAIELGRKLLDPNKKHDPISLHNQNVPEYLVAIIDKLLQKSPRNRFNSASEVLESLEAESGDVVAQIYDLSPRFTLLLNQDLNLLKEFTSNSRDKLLVQNQANFFEGTTRKGMNDFCSQEDSVIQQIDPGTSRLLYPGSLNMPGFAQLPYTPENLNGIKDVININFFKDPNKLEEYARKIIDYQIQHGAENLIAPYHYFNSKLSTPGPSGGTPFYDWIDIDTKLLNFCSQYTPENYPGKPLHSSISFASETLLNDEVTDYILNKYSSFNCDGYIVYVDKISLDSDEITLKKYIDFLLNLQKSTGRPVTAGRVGLIGFLLLALGVSGFSSGPGERDTFYEDLMTQEQGGFAGATRRYFFPSVLYSSIIPNKGTNPPPPIEFINLEKRLGKCECISCKSTTQIDERITPLNTKLHFLHQTNSIIEILSKLDKKERLEYIGNWVSASILFFEKEHVNLGIKTTKFKYLKVWDKLLQYYHV